MVGYQRKEALTGTLVATEPLELPESTLCTRAVWWVLDPALIDAVGVDPHRLPGALHAAEHAAIGMLPLFAICDRWDVGGLSTPRHADTGWPTVIVYDAVPGGAGVAELAYEAADAPPAGHPGQHRGLPLHRRVPVVRAVAQVRQRQRPARQGRAQSSLLGALLAGDPSVRRLTGLRVGAPRRRGCSTGHLRDAGGRSGSSPARPCRLRLHWPASLAGLAARARKRRWNAQAASTKPVATGTAMPRPAVFS